MKALSLWQPYASAIPMKLKHYETRSWTTRYRGPLVIAAAQTLKGIGTLPTIQRNRIKKAMDVFPLMDLPTGVALCVCDLVDVVRTESLVASMSDTEVLFGDWLPNRYAWRLERVRAFPTPMPIKGKQGLFTCPQDIADYCQGLAP